MIWNQVFYTQTFSVCRYNCPANCMDRRGKVWGTLYYDVVRISLRSNRLSYPDYVDVFLTANVLFLAIQYLSRCHSSWCNWRQRRPCGHHKKRQHAVLCKSKQKWCWVLEVSWRLWFCCHHSSFVHNFSYSLRSVCFFSKYKPGNAFMVSKVEGKWNLGLVYVDRY